MVASPSFPKHLRFLVCISASQNGFGWGPLAMASYPASTWAGAALLEAEVRNSTVAVEEGLDSNYGGWHDADMLRWEGVYVAKCCELVNKVHVFIRFSFQVQCRYRYISIKTYMLSFTWSPEYLTHDCQRSSARQKRSEWTVQVSKFVPCRIHWIIMNYINTMNTWIQSTIHLISEAIAMVLPKADEQTLKSSLAKRSRP